jgi:hypothetical protein
LRVRIEKVLPAEAGRAALGFPPLAHPRSLPIPPDIVRYGAAFGGDEQQGHAP